MSEAGQDLFTCAGTARSSDPDTSWEAALRNLSGKRTDRREALMAHAAFCDTGLTDFALASLMERQQTSVGKRRGELRDWGLVEDRGTRRPSPSGSPAIVWRITERGRRMARALREGGQ